MRVDAMLRTLFWMALVVAAVVAPSSAMAQGRCRCNSGCHQYPGQCVQSGSSGCESGYAPFCGTRAGDCPRVGFVSCNGECTCVRIGPTDAGAVDVPASFDVPGAPDAPMSVDRPATADIPMSVDRPASDVPASFDATVPPVDAPVTTADAPVTPADRPAGSDAVTPTSDVPTVSVDAPVVLADGAVVQPDAPPCVCPGGVCIAGRCVTERCVFQMELGFVCNAPGTACRLVDGEPYCVPLCLGLTCEAGQFCDDESNGECVVDRCATTTCPTGLSCYHNQCRRMLSDGGYAPFGDDGGAPSGDGGAGAVDDGSCGCRAGAPSSPRGWLGLSALCVALLARRRRAA